MKAMIWGFRLGRFDTHTGNDPIRAAGNDAPDYYKNNQVTWDTRRNQPNPPA